MLTNKVPLIFEKEIYASACLAGGISYLALTFLEALKDINFIISASVIIIIRLISVKYELELPKINDDLFSKKQ